MPAPSLEVTGPKIHGLIISAKQTNGAQDGQVRSPRKVSRDERCDQRAGDSRGWERHVLSAGTAPMGAQDTLLLPGKAQAVTPVKRGREERNMAHLME